MEWLRALYRKTKSQFKSSGNKSWWNEKINKLKTPIMLPNYNYCGPGTRIGPNTFEEVNAVNKLDQACKVHDMVYTFTNDTQSRHNADLQLIESSVHRIVARDASLLERIWAFLISVLMWFKTKTE